MDFIGHRRVGALNVTATPSLVVVQHFVEELKRLVPTK
jgi:hypothetical protein